MTSSSAPAWMMRTVPGLERRVLGKDSELAGFSRRDDHLGGAGEDLLLRAHDVDVQGLGHDVFLWTPTPYWSVFAFSSASSIGPTM
jgi:hypothetical protein